MPPRTLERFAPDPRLKVPTLLDEACDNFEREVGGRKALITHLAHARLVGGQEYLVGAIADPRNDDLSLARICTIHGLSFSELLVLFRDAGIMRAQLNAMRKVWKALPEVAGDLLSRAVPYTIECLRCRGTGELKRKSAEGEAVTKPCRVCNGSGKTQVEPRLETQKIALQLGGLLLPGATAPQVQVNVQQTAGALPTHLDFARRADEQLYASTTGSATVQSQVSWRAAGRGPTINATPVELEEEDAGDEGAEEV